MGIVYETGPLVKGFRPLSEAFIQGLHVFRHFPPSTASLTCFQPPVLFFGRRPGTGEFPPFYRLQTGLPHTIRFMDNKKTAMHNAADAINRLPPTLLPVTQTCRSGP